MGKLRVARPRFPPRNSHTKAGYAPTPKVVESNPSHFDVTRINGKIPKKRYMQIPAVYSPNQGCNRRHKNHYPGSVQAIKKT